MIYKDISGYAEKCNSCQAYVQKKLLSSTFVGGLITQVPYTFLFLPIK